MNHTQQHSKPDDSVITYVAEHVVIRDPNTGEITHQGRG